MERCPICGGQALLLGVLGNSHHYKCIQCNWEFTKDKVSEEFPMVDCESCVYKSEEWGDGGYCYMFREEPHFGFNQCGQFHPVIKRGKLNAPTTEPEAIQPTPTGLQRAEDSCPSPLCDEGEGH